MLCNLKKRSPRNDEQWEEIASGSEGRLLRLPEQLCWVSHRTLNPTYSLKAGKDRIDSNAGEPRTDCFETGKITGLSQ